MCETERRAWIHLSVLCCTWDGLPWANVCWAFLEEKKPNESFLWDSEKRLINPNILITSCLRQQSCLKTLYFLFIKLEIDLWHHIFCQIDAKEQLKEWPAQWRLMYNIAFLMQFVFQFDTIHFPSYSSMHWVEDTATVVWSPAQWSKQANKHSTSNIWKWNVNFPDDLMLTGFLTWCKANPDRDYRLEVVVNIYWTGFLKAIQWWTCGEEKSGKTNFKPQWIAAHT